MADPMAKQNIAQYCNNCDTLRIFKYIGMQERLRDDDIPLYNCIVCESTQVEADYDNKQKLERLLKENK